MALDEHGKMPDVVVYDRKRDWLFLIEAVTSHGPVNAKRMGELKALLAREGRGVVLITLRPAPFVSFPFGLARGVDHVNDRHGIGGLVYEVVDHVPHDGLGADVLCLEFANERKGVRVGLKSDRAMPDPGQPVGGSACPGLLGDVPRHLSQRLQRPRREDDFKSTHNSRPSSSARSRIASRAGIPGSPVR